jgi:hypothetical protein
MTTIVQFSPSPRQAFSFQATLDQQVYQLQVRWNTFGQRWYLQCLGTNGVLIFNLPLIGSPDNGSINLIGGYFQVSQMVFRYSTQQFEITP